MKSASRNIGLPAPICVVGMHRSGTSLTARMLDAVGVDFGPAALMYPADAIDAPDGYHEQLAVVELDDELLRLLGGHASEPPSPKPGWERAAAVEPFVERGRRMFSELFRREPWGFKDPRASLLVPFWLRVEPRLRFVVCVRNPLEVAISMDRRGGPYPLEHWFDVWLQHTADALASTAGRDRTIILFEDLHGDPEATAQLLAEFVHGPGTAAGEAATSLVVPARRRSARSADDLTSDARVPRSIADYYSALCDLARKSAAARRARAGSIDFRSSIPIKTAPAASIGHRRGA